MIEEVVQKVVPGGRVVGSRPLKGGMVAEMTAVVVEAPDGRILKLVVRRPSTLDEFKTLQLVHAWGLPAPEPYYWDESGWLVTEFVAGEMVFGPGDVDDYGRQMAEKLAAIHWVSVMTAELAGFDLSFLRRREGYCVEMGRARPFVGADGLVGGLDVGRIEAILAKGPPGPGNGLRLIHGDFWAGNLLWREGELAAVVDWEDAALGEPLMDLAQARVELVWLLGVEAAERFLEHYRGLVDFDFGNLAYWDLCAVLRMVRLVKGDWGWLVEFAGQYGRGDLTREGIGGEYGRLVEWLSGVIG